MSIKIFNLKSKFSIDVSWNVISLMGVALIGLAINVLIARYFGAHDLGVFNQTYAFFIFASQFAVGGIHFSVLKHTAQWEWHQRHREAILVAALLAVLTPALAICILLYFLSPMIGQWFDSPDLGQSLRYMLPGLGCFAINKVIMMHLNGLRWMRLYGALHLLRAVFMGAWIGWCVLGALDGVRLSWMFSVAEAMLLFILLAIVFLLLKPVVRLRHIGVWIKRHWQFGYQVFFGNALIEVNMRVDVIMLGLFASDTYVGIYSFAAFFVEGLIQLLCVIRANINPIITQLYTTHQKQKLLADIRKRRIMFSSLMIAVGFISVVGYPFVLYLFQIAAGFQSSWLVFAILMTGLCVSSGYFLYNMILNQMGFPFQQTIFILQCFLVNVVLNAILIPLFGMVGAAMASAIAMVAAIYLLKRIVYQQTQLWI